MQHCPRFENQSYQLPVLAYAFPFLLPVLHLVRYPRDLVRHTIERTKPMFLGLFDIKLVIESQNSHFRDENNADSLTLNRRSPLRHCIFYRRPAKDKQAVGRKSIVVSQ